MSEKDERTDTKRDIDEQFGKMSKERRAELRKEREEKYGITDMDTAFDRIEALEKEKEETGGKSKMGKYYELNNLEIEIYGFPYPVPKEDELKFDKLVEKAKKLKEEIVKECEEAIKHLSGLIKNCSNAFEMLSITTNENELRSLLRLVIERIKRLDPENVLFKN